MSRYRVGARYPEGALWILNRAKILRMTHDQEGATRVLKEGSKEGRTHTFAQADTMVRWVPACARIWEYALIGGCSFGLSWTLLQEKKYEEAANTFVKTTELNSWYVSISLSV